MNRQLLVTLLCLAFPSCLFGLFGDEERPVESSDGGTTEDAAGGDESADAGDETNDETVDPTPSCADSWDGQLYPGYILVLQEGGPTASDYGGDIHAFDPTGCYLGKVFTELTPWYAYGLKTSAQQYATNFVEIASVQGGSLAMPILRWTGTSSSTTGFELGTFATPTDGNGANTDYADLKQSTFQVAFTALYDSQRRFVAYNGENKIKSYFNGSVQSGCEVSTTGKVVGDISASISYGGLASKTFYVWTTATSGANFGVASITPCTSGSVTHSNLFSASGNDLRATGVLEVRNPSTTWHQDILVTVGAYFGGQQHVQRWHYDGSSWANQGEPFANRAHAVTQDAYRTGSFSANWGDLYTVESDSTKVHLRRYRTDAGYEGTLRATLYSEPLSQGPAFKAGFSPGGTWIAVIPPPY